MNQRALSLGLLLLTAGLFISSTATAQFSYAGLRLSYHNVRFDKGVDFDGTRINDLALNLDLVHRPLRNVGIGVSARLPVMHGFKYLFADDEYGANIIGGGSFNESQVEFAEGEFEYNIKNTYSLTFFGRVYFDTEINYFLDLRYTLENYEESFTFHREDRSLPDRNINYAGNVTAKGLGFSIGSQPKISEHFYLSYVFTVDFLSYDQLSFEYDIESYSSKQTTKISSKIQGKQTAYEFSFGVGYIY